MSPFPVPAAGVVGGRTNPPWGVAGGGREAVEGVEEEEVSSNKVAIRPPDPEALTLALLVEGAPEEAGDPLLVATFSRTTSPLTILTLEFFMFFCCSSL